jgi:hypothetical protein
LNRAEIHRHEFSNWCDFLRKAIKHDLRRETDCEGSEHRYTLHLPEDSNRFALIGSDFLHNVRAGLDNLAFRLAELNMARVGKTVPDDDASGIKFPICFNEDEWNARWRTNLARTSGDAKKLIKSFQPYKRSNPADADPLWIIRELQNIDKHRYMVRLKFDVDGLRWNEVPGCEVKFTPGEVFTNPSGPKSGMELGTFSVSPPSLEVDLEPDPAPAVAIDQGPGEGMNLLSGMFLFLGRAREVFERARSLPECR